MAALSDLSALSVADLQAALDAAKARERALSEKISFEAEIQDLEDTLFRVLDAAKIFGDAQDALNRLSDLFTTGKKTAKIERAEGKKRAPAMPTTSIADGLRRDSAVPLKTYLVSAYGEKWHEIQSNATCRTILAALYKAILQAKDSCAETLSQSDRLDKILELQRMGVVSRAEKTLEVCIYDLLYHYGFGSVEGLERR